MKKVQKPQFVTKKDLKKVLEDTELALMIRIDERAEKNEENLKEAIRQSTNDLMTKIDGIAKGLDDMRDEDTAGTDLIEKLEVKVSDHDKRIDRLESSQAA